MWIRRNTQLISLTHIKLINYFLNVNMLMDKQFPITMITLYFYSSKTTFIANGNSKFLFQRFDNLTENIFRS